MSTTPLENALYYGLSRPTFVIGSMCILLSILTGHYGFARAFLSTNNMRIIARSLAIGCVLEILVIQIIFCSNQAPLGIYLSFPVCLLFGLGFIFLTCLIGVPLTIFFEGPMIRVI